MTEVIDLIGSKPLPPPPVVAKGPSAPADVPDLRETEAGVTAVQEATKAAEQASQNAGGVKELEDAINQRLERLLRTNIRVQIELDKGSGDFVYKSIDKDTGEVDRQWPAETILRMLAFFRELEGLLLDKKA